MLSGLWTFLAGLASGTAAAMGLGGGFVLFLYLNLCTELDFSACQVMNLLFFLPCAALASVRYGRQGKLKPKLLLPMGAAGCLGALAGRLLSGVIGTALLRYAFGAALLLIGFRELFYRKSAG